MNRVIIIRFLFLMAVLVNSVNAQVLSNGSITPAIEGEVPFFDATTNFDFNFAPYNEGKGFLFPRTDLTTWFFKLDALDGILFPSAFNGMIVYNVGTGNTMTGLNNPNFGSNVSPGFYYFYNPNATTSVANGRWIRLGAAYTPPTNTNAVVTSYNCSNALTGTLTVGVPVTGVTKIIIANVAAVGAYNISASANGVTFSASGTFTSIGIQNIVLTATGTPIVAGSAVFNLNTLPGCSFIENTTNPGVITLSQVRPYLIASVYDQDYYPYTVTTNVAEFPSDPLSEVANGVNEADTLDFQGTLTTTPITIKIPYTVTFAAVVLPVYSQTITIPASYTEDGISRDATFSFGANTYPVGNGFIFATLRANGGTLNVKKLDIQTGLGTDYLGVLLAQFTYPANNFGGSNNFQLRAISGIPDKNIGDSNHVMLYLPVEAADGKIWLNNNLGANYATLSNPMFNPSLQASSSTDFNAYGSLFQWGRYSDGHELINWTGATSGTTVNGTTTTQSDSPTNALFINSYTDWRITPSNSLWEAESSANNPCPFGFKIPTELDFYLLRIGLGIIDQNTAFNSSLKFSFPGLRKSDNGDLIFNGTGYYWIERFDPTTNYRYVHVIDNSGNSNNLFVVYKTFAFSIRCIKNS